MSIISVKAANKTAKKYYSSYRGRRSHDGDEKSERFSDLVDDVFDFLGTIVLLAVFLAVFILIEGVFIGGCFGVMVCLGVALEHFFGVTIGIVADVVGTAILTVLYHAVIIWAMRSR